MKTSLEAFNFFKFLTRGRCNFDASDFHFHDHSKEKILFERPIEEKYNCCLALKSEGNELFKSGDYKSSLSMYRKVMIQLDYTFPEDEDYLKKFEDIKLTTNLNMAIVNYKLNNFNDSIQHCNEVLSDYPDNLKALTRKAMSFMALCKLNEAKPILMKILHLDENSEYAKQELERIKQIESKTNKEERNLYKSMLNQF